VKTTRYFDEQVRRKRPELRDEWIEQVIAEPTRRTDQGDGRIRFWSRVELDDGKRYMLRVVTLGDGETVLNAFFDRGYKEAGT
jgi:hypothetical protein